MRRLLIPLALLTAANGVIFGLWPELDLALVEALRGADGFHDRVEGLRQLRARHLEPRLRQIELALATSGSDSDSDPISLLKERSELQRQLRQPVVLTPAV